MQGSHSYQDIQNLRGKLEEQADREESASKHAISKRASKERYNVFKRLVVANFKAALASISPQELFSVGVKAAEDLNKEAVLFYKIINKAFEVADQGTTERQQNPYFWTWRNAFITGDAKALLAELRHSFISFAVRQHLSADAIQCHEKLADFQYPHEWFPATRTMQRTIHLHVGPTNSGKTYNALKALENAKTGVYAGPLRLLAHETYMRMLAKNRRVALMTGEEQRIPEGDEQYIASCTVEMTPLNRRVDVAVIDEIQMIGDEYRGWAWTQAVLGVQAKEVHLCGEERAVPLIEALCARTGDEVVIHRYNRLSPLQPASQSLGGRLARLEKGDAVVSFSRVNIHGLKRGIEQATGKKCAIVYGSLPPETRAQQAALFNDPNNDYDYLAASDAIGMGLNLEVKRVIFEAVQKFDGSKMRILTVPELKQIGGRAGRFKSAAAHAIQDSAGQTTVSAEAQNSSSTDISKPGTVTSLETADLRTVQDSFKAESPPLKAAGLFPPSSVIEKFASYFPVATPMTFILLRLRDIARMSSDFQMCEMRDSIEIARAIQPFPLSIQDRCLFLNAPVTMRDLGCKDALVALAKRVARNESGDLLDVTEIKLDLLDHNSQTYPGGKAQFLRQLESLHKALTLYLWLSYRFNTVFKSQRVAFRAKELVEEAINECLEELDFSSEDRARRVAMARKQIRKQQKETLQVFGDEDEDGSSDSDSKAATGVEHAMLEGQDHRESVASSLR